MEPVVVTTEHRGVFFGYLGTRDDDNRRVTLTDARNCVYWSASTKGFLGLASTGPLDGSKVGPKVPELRLYNVTSITRCSDDATSRWESGPWS